MRIVCIMIIIRIMISIFISSRIRISITIQKFSAGKKIGARGPYLFITWSMISMMIMMATIDTKTMRNRSIIVPRLSSHNGPSKRGHHRPIVSGLSLRLDCTKNPITKMSVETCKLERMLRSFSSESLVLLSSKDSRPMVQCSIVVDCGRRYIQLDRRPTDNKSLLLPVRDHRP